MIRMIKPLLGSFAGGRTGRPTILMIMQTRIDWQIDADGLVIKGRRRSHKDNP